MSRFLVASWEFLVGLHVDIIILWGHRATLLIEYYIIFKNKYLVFATSGLNIFEYSSLLLFVIDKYITLTMEFY